jgi:hypothetical protein
MFTTLLSLFLALAANKAPDRPSTVPRRALVPASVRPIEAPPFPYFLTETQCDNDGNLYFHVKKGDYNATELLRLSPNGSSATLFTLSPDFAAKVYFSGFSVTPDGEVYALESDSKQTFLVDFDADGTMRSPSPVELSEHLVTTEVLALGHGELLYSGYYAVGAPKQLQGKTLVAIIDASGKLRRRVDLSIPAVDASMASNLPSEAGGAVDRSGNLYFLTSTEIAVLAQDGTVVRRISFQKPDSKSAAIHLRIAGSTAAITLATDKANSGVEMSYLLVSTETGKTLALYEPSSELKTADDVCFSSEVGFTFVNVRNGKMELVTAPVQ